MEEEESVCVCVGVCVCVCVWVYVCVFGGRWQTDGQVHRDTERQRGIERSGLGGEVKWDRRAKVKRCVLK